MNESGNVLPLRTPHHGHRRQPYGPRRAILADDAPPGTSPSRRERSSPRPSPRPRLSQSPTPSGFWVHHDGAVAGAGTEAVAGNGFARPPQRPTPCGVHNQQPSASPYRYDIRPDSLAGGPGPHWSPAASRILSAYRPPSNADARISQYSASNYSDVSTKPSPETTQQTTFGHAPQAPIPSPSGNPPQIRRAPSSKYSRLNPFVDTIQEVSEPSSSDKHSRRTSESSIPLRDFVGVTRRSPNLDEERQGLVREASVGKRHQSPRLTTISRNNSCSSKLSEKSDSNARRTIEPESPPPLPNLGPGLRKSPLPRDAASESAIASSAALRTPLVPPPLRSPNGSPYPRSASSPKSSLKTTPSPRPAETPNINFSRNIRPMASPASPASAPTIPRAKTPLTPPESRFSRATAPGPGGKLFLLPPRKKSLKERVGDRKPSNLNIDAVKQAEARGSITSLPSLMQRALTLASNIEGGKTASKNTDWFGNDLLRQLARRGKSTASLGHVLEGFTFSPHVDDQRRKALDADSPFSDKFENTRKAPSAGARTTPEPVSHFEKSPTRTEHPRRACCGMPLWLFALLAVALIVLIALAVILPVVLVVVPKQNQQGTNLGCSTTHPCPNGGASVSGAAPGNCQCICRGGYSGAAPGNCQCICRGGYSGANCTDASTQGCGAIQAQTVPDATIGAALVGLIDAAPATFQIPLNATAIVLLLSTNDLTCSSQNALVTLNGQTSKRSSIHQQRAAAPALPPMILPPATTLPPVTTTLAPRQGDIATSNGLQIAGMPTQTSGGGGGSGVLPTSTAPTAPALPPGFDLAAPQTLDLARTAILFALQASGTLHTGVVAQSQLQAFLNSGTGGDPRSVDLGNGYTVDLTTGHVWGNGQSVGRTS